METLPAGSSCDYFDYRLLVRSNGPPKVRQVAWSSIWGIRKRAELLSFAGSVVYDIRASSVDRDAALRRRQPPPSSSTPVVVTFSDGEGSSSVAVAIWSPLAPGGIACPRWLQVDVPKTVQERWSSQESGGVQHINKLEALGPALVVGTWGHLVRGCLWLHFIDNNVAMDCFISGYSKGSAVLSEIIDYTWHRIAQLRCWPWFERVPSECNIVDGLTRKDFEFAIAGAWERDVAICPSVLAITH